jgi:4-hydroxybenzoate polyprenyltransferase
MRRAKENAALPDAIASHPIWRYAPDVLRPYVQLARLDRPIGWWLLLLPCWQSSALASVAYERTPNFYHLALFLIGAIAMRGAGSTYNDYVDRDIDGKVERTKARPLASGAISPRAAIFFMLAQCLIGLFVLLSFNATTITLACIAPAIVMFYPFAKRFTSWPQAILGLAFAYGALLGWTAETTTLSAPAFFLYLSAVLWTIGYDTIYALQDLKDDIAAGVRSTARLFGENVQAAVGLLYAGAAVSAGLAVFYAAGGGGAWIGVSAFAAHLIWQINALRRDMTPAQALYLFRSNRDAGLLLFAGFLLQSLRQIF